MHQEKNVIVISLAMSLLSLASPAIAAKVACEFNRATGKLEPTLAWKNTLGAEAEAACAQAMPVNMNRVASVSPVNSVGAAPSRSEKFVPSAGLTMPQLAPQPNNANATMTATALSNNQRKAPMLTELTWRVELKDITLSTTFARWADTAGWKIRWDADKNILIDAPNSHSGTFEDAIASVLSSDGIQRGIYPLEVCFYSNTPPLARITRKGEQKDCK